MSEDNTNSANHKAPKLCKTGCGFFGSDATGDCCSKCWTDSLKSQEKQLEREQQCRKSQPATVPAEHEPVPMEVDPIKSNQTVVAPEISKTTEAPASTPRTIPLKKKKKKKKKKTSYKNMMSTMMTSSSSDEKKGKDNKANINKSLGGGAFTKVDRI